MRDALAATRRGAAGIGLGNVDERLRQVFGDEYGLVVETAPGRRHQGQPAGPQVPTRRSHADERGRHTLRRAAHGPPTWDGGGIGGLTVLAVDDEAPALSELSYLLRRDPHVREGVHRRQRRGGATGSSPRPTWTPSSSTSACRGFRRGVGPRPGGPTRSPGRRLRHRLRRARRRRLRSGGGRLRAQAGPTRTAGRGDTPDRGTTAVPHGGAHRRPGDGRVGLRADRDRTGRGNPVRAALARCATSSRTGTTRDCTRRPARTWCACRWRRWPNDGPSRLRPHPPQLPGCAGPRRGGAAVVRAGKRDAGRHRATGEPPAHPGAS